MAITKKYSKFEKANIIRDIVDGVRCSHLHCNLHCPVDILYTQPWSVQDLIDSLEQKEGSSMIRK